MVARDKKLHAVYVTNFRCGPDSFLLNFFEHASGEKPYLQIEIDEHSADAGAITRAPTALRGEEVPLSSTCSHPGPGSSSSRSAEMVTVTEPDPSTPTSGSTRNG